MKHELKNMKKLVRIKYHIVDAGYRYHHNILAYLYKL